MQTAQRPQTGEAFSLTRSCSVITCPPGKACSDGYMLTWWASDLSHQSRADGRIILRLWRAQAAAVEAGPPAEAGRDWRTGPQIRVFPHVCQSDSLPAETPSQMDDADVRVLHSRTQFSVVQR